MKIFRARIKSESAVNLNLHFVALQHCFSQACQLVARIALQSGCFSRVRLHHFAYKAVRERFPELGSQLASNAIYAVCRKARGLGIPTLQTLQFGDDSPVFFDRHTLSVRRSTLSMFTLDGRMKFQVSLSQEFLQLFKESQLKEVQLLREGNQFFLLFSFKEVVSNQVISEIVELAA